MITCEVCIWFFFSKIMGYKTQKLQWQSSSDAYVTKWSEGLTFPFKVFQYEHLIIARNTYCVCMSSTLSILSIPFSIYVDKGVCKKNSHFWLHLKMQEKTVS